MRILLLGLLPVSLFAAEIVPRDSQMAGQADLAPVLVTAMEAGEPVGTGGWMMKSIGTREFTGQPKLGRSALEIVAESEGKGKVSATLSSAIPKNASRLGVWVYRDGQGNVGEVGFEVIDAEGELHLLKTETTEDGWQWLEADLEKGGFRPSFPQDKQGKNGTLDLPLRSAGLYLFAKSPGSTRLGVDALVAATPKTSEEARPSLKMVRGSASEPGQPLVLDFVATNPTDQPWDFELEVSIQQDSQMLAIPPASTGEIPVLGREIERKRIKASLPPRSFDFINVTSDQKYPTGAYLAATRLVAPGGLVTGEHVFVLPEGKLKPGFASRFGINANDDLQIEAIQRMGMGWVRFENLKWPMMSKEPDFYAFDGTKGPVNADRILQAYHDAGLEVLPYLYMTARYASPEPDKKNYRVFAPTDNSLYAEFCRQTVARFGRTEVPASELLTADKKSAKGILKVVELWNEPNLQDPGWGHWIGTTAAYLELLRAGAEAVKKTDPKMLISPAGWAGVDLEYVAELGSYTYADGKRPADFIDLVNVHQYTGTSAPELARVNTNIDRDGKPAEGALLTERLQKLVDWRDATMPGKEIWMTETGFDTGGPRAVSRRRQAAYSARNQLVMFGSGIDKIFIYRTVGDSPVLYGASGLLASNNQYKPAYFSTAAQVRLLDQFSRATLLPPQGNTWRAVFEKDGKKILAAWAVEDGATLGLDLGPVTVVDAFGYRESRTVGPDEPLGAFPVYFTDLGNTGQIDAMVQAVEADKKRRQAELATLSSLRAYLYDFGSRERIGGVQIGSFRRGTPVVTGDFYSEKVGFGFTEDARTSDLDAHWIKNLSDRDSCRVKAGGRFIFKPEPGNYTLSLRIKPVSTRTPAAIVVEGNGVNEQLEFTKDDPVREFEAKLDGEVSVVFKHDADIAWLRAVEKR